MIILEKGKYYYDKVTHETMRYDGWAMQTWATDVSDGIEGICWMDVPPNENLEEVTWGTRAIPLQDFSQCEHY